MRRSLLALLVLAAACSDTGSTAPDGAAAHDSGISTTTDLATSLRDASAMTDASAITDSDSAITDASAQTDASAGTDAAGTSDGAIRSDASAPTDAALPVDASGHAIAHFTPGTSLYWQLTGTVDTTRAEAAYDIDLFDAAPDGSQLHEPDGTTITLSGAANPTAIADLHARGKKVICYIDTGAWEQYRPDASKFPSSILGNVDPSWPMERWLDIRKVSWPAFEGVLLARFDLAARLGCDGVEGDQNNSADNNPGFPITYDDEIAWYSELADQLHARGLAAVMKNGVEVLASSSAGAVIGKYDAALNEQCNEFSECGGYAPFISGNKVVWNVEYNLATTAFCPMDTAANFDGYLAALALDGSKWQACR